MYKSNFVSVSVLLLFFILFSSSIHADARMGSIETAVVDNDNAQIFNFADSILCQKNASDSLQFGKNTNKDKIQPLKLLVWNVEKFKNELSLDDITYFLQDADLVLIQEAMHDLDLQNYFTKGTNHVFQFYKSFCKDTRATGVNTASRWPILETKNFVSPDVEPIVQTPKVTGYARIEIRGQQVHVFNTHALNANFGSSFKRQIEAVAEFIATLEGPVIWAGDFNTWSKNKQSLLDDVTTKLGLNHLIPEKDDRKLKLDHIYVRGFTAKSAIVRHEETSDHFPLEAILE